jgi:hypothetical protein
MKISTPNLFDTCRRIYNPQEMYVSDQNLLYYDVACFHDLVVPVVVGLIPLQHQRKASLCSSEQNCKPITAPAVMIA